ncbi:SMI1/KNR4 family protein, partial [Sulfurimonas sp.]
MDTILKESFQKQSQNFSQDKIKEIEEYFSITLPNEYKEFLLEYGAVVIHYGEPDSFETYYKKDDKKEVLDILNFLSTDEIIEGYETLREDKYEGEPQIPKYMIPIAHMNDSYQRDYVLLNSIDGTIWSTLEDDCVASDLDSFGYVAKDFKAFIDSINYYKEDTPKPNVKKSVELAPKDGRYQAILPPDHPQANDLKKDPFAYQYYTKGKEFSYVGLEEYDLTQISWE